MVDIRIDLQKLRQLPLRLKVVAAVVVLDLVVLVAGYMVLDDVMAERVREVEQLRANLVQVRRKNEELRHQVDEYPSLRQRYDKAIADGIMNPLDRLALVKSAQDGAAHHRLSDLQYRIQPDPAKPLSSPLYKVETDRAVFENGGLLDSDVMSFWADLTSRQSAHYRVAAVELERIRDIDGAVLTAIRHGTPATILRAKIDLQWIGVLPNSHEAQ